MPKIPVIKPRKLIKVLHKLSFNEVRQKGSHLFFARENDHKNTVIPIHNQDIGKGLLKQILNDIDLSVEEFIKLL